MSFLSQIILSFAVYMHSLPPWLTTTNYVVRLGSQSCKVFNVMVVKSLKMSLYANHWQYWLVCFFVGTNWYHLLPFRKTTFDLFHYIFLIYLYSFCIHYYVQMKKIKNHQIDQLVWRCKYHGAMSYTSKINQWTVIILYYTTESMLSKYKA